MARKQKNKGRGTKTFPYPKCICAIHEMLDDQELDRLFDYLEIYRNSLDDDEEIEKADRLKTYFRNNREESIWVRIVPTIT